MTDIKKDPEQKVLIHQHLRVLRIASIGIGGSIMAFALFADLLGYGTPGSFGIGQFLLLLIGLTSVLLGFLGKKFITFYQSAAIILLNIIMLFVFLELGAIMISRIGQKFDADGHKRRVCVKCGGDL